MSKPDLELVIKPKKTKRISIATWQFLFLLILVFWLIATPGVKAATCQSVTGKQVCIENIKRSAKYYWEYRVNLIIDNQKQSTRVYNCRDHYYTLPDRTKVYYQQNAPLAKLVCRLYS